MSRGWFFAIYEKCEDMLFLMEYEQDDPDEFLVLVDDLEQIIINIKDHLKTKYALPRTASSSDEEDEKTEK